MTNGEYSDLSDALKALEASSEPLAPYQAMDTIAKVRPANAPAPVEMQAELLAFRLLDELERAEPATSECYDLPTDPPVTGAMLDYWKQRATFCTHPVMRAMYADLVWDLSRRATGQSADVSFARIAIDGFLDGAKERKLEYEHPIFAIIARALALSLSIGDKQRGATAIQILLDFEDAVGVDKHPGLWGHAYILLMQDKGAPLTDDQRRKIITDLESRLARTTNTTADTFEPWSAEHAANLLADHYRRAGNRTDVERVMRLYVAAFQAMCKQGSPLQQQAWLRRVHDTLLQFGLTADAQSIVIQLKKIGPSVKRDMKTISVNKPISAEKMRQYIEAMTEGDLDAVFPRIAGRFIPRRTAIEEQARNSGIFNQIFSTTLQDHAGRPIASVGPLSDDPEGQIVMQMAQHIALQEIFLSAVLDAAQKKFSLTPETLTEHIMGSAVLTEEDQPILLSGVTAYLENRHIDAIHTLVPRIEMAIRTLHELSGVPIMRPNRNGGFDLLMLHELLRTPVAEKALTPDIVLYLRVLLVDPRGWNIRNNVCHGLTPANSFSRAVSDRLLHVLLILSNIRKTATDHDGTNGT